MSSGTCFEYLCILLPIQGLQATPGSSYGLSSLPSITDIYMEYFEELALGPQCPIPTPWLKRHVDDVIHITKKRPSGNLIESYESIR